MHQNPKTPKPQNPMLRILEFIFKKRSKTFRKGEHALLREINQTRSCHISLVFIDQSIQIDSVISYILWTFLIVLNANRRSTFVHIDRTETEAQDV